MGVVDDPIGMHLLRTPTALDRLLDTPDRVAGQQLQHADVLPSAGRGTVSLFQCFMQKGELRRQASIAVDVGVVFPLPLRGRPVEGNNVPTGSASLHPWLQSFAPLGQGGI
jgi:hypothetical protein